MVFQKSPAAGGWTQEAVGGGGGKGEGGELGRD